jgi:hypothetical protein
VSKTIKDLCLITGFVLLSTFLIWLPHFLSLSNFWGLNFSNGFNTIYRNFDGLEYIVIAKTFYDPSLIAGIPQPMPAGYYAAHFPGFPIVIAFLAPLFGYLKSMLVVSLFFTVASTIAFYFLVKDFKLTSHPLALALTFLLLPARWVIVHSVGSPEPMFIFFIILSVYFFLRITINNSRLAINIYLSAIFAAFAQLIRPPGILLVFAYGLFILWQAFRKKSFLYPFKFYPLILVPLTLVGVFWWYGQAYGDFFAFFHSGDNIHLTFPPFQIFNVSQYWVGTIWLEDVIYLFIFGLLAGLLLIKQKLYPLAFFVFTYLVASMFVAHRDLSRYTLPIAPFVLIAFEKLLVSKEFKIVLAILTIAIYLYSQNYIINNVAPVADLSIYN